MKVLIVDDTRDIVSLFRDVLETRGDCEISVAYSGVEALQSVKAHKPDLIILDVLLPDLSGMEVVQALRSEAETSAIPVIMASGVAEAPEEEERKRLGIIEFLRKPVSMKALTSKVGELSSLMN